ncbi:Flagellar biosynthesis protein FlhF [Citrifermentans bremense]|uniref:Flagellar biosynthesis protein FlhF n=1 Tax=Citrifermentans bremense TaxID=60035 RepID=A0A6S6MAP2_9BACT|nr:flagellar biosynthesis protein FlhF [Citrifermentans bremense]BCG48906.1 Flagellar biosynthesis protein FlhF [Citrifermentans bremense]
MLVKTFQAGEMSEALRMVKAEMGLDAMILSSKKARRGGILGYFSKPYFEVTAALEPRPAQRSNPYREEPQPVQERELSTREEFQNSMLGPLAREVRELKLRLEALTRRDAELAQQAVAPAPEPQQELAQQSPRVFAKEELEEIKKLLYNAVAGNKEKQSARPVSFPMASLAEEPQPEQPELTRQTIVQAVRGEQPLLDMLAEELRGEELGSQTVELLLEQLRAPAEDGACLDELRGLLAEAVAGMVKCSGSLRMKKTGPRIMALVGPTGVGKTTTIAKLAAMHALNRGVSVAMITTDNFRVGAVEQLKTYAKIMDLPLEVASSGVELNAALAKHSDKDLILIDTAGRSPKDSERIDELRGYLECTPGIEAYLCLSATTRSYELDEVIATFGVLPISRLLFTKLDESRKFGCIVETYLKHKLPLSYLSTGQKVPEDLEVATPRKIASLVVKESA